jgi:acyl-CoA-binding protein
MLAAASAVSGSSRQQIHRYGQHQHIDLISPRRPPSPPPFAPSPLDVNKPCPIPSVTTPRPLVAVVGAELTITARPWSLDRVFAHALQTVRKIPRTGSARPPPEARLQLYGLYKQSMGTSPRLHPRHPGSNNATEGDVTGVMSRPHTPTTSEDDRAELEKWEAWHAQAGLSKTEAKRRYISTLIDTMHRYASSTTEARELVSELEFVWDQIRSNEEDGEYDDEDEDEMEMEGIEPAPYGEEEVERVWRGRVEKALAKMTTEVAALREQLESRRVEKRRARAKRVWVWLAWCVLALARHLVIEAIFWGLVMLWMRRRGDKRAQEALKIVGRFVKEGLRELGLGRRKRAPR